MVDVEATDTFACFGSRCAAFVTGPGPEGSAPEAVALIRRELLSWHERFSRFRPDSELSLLNGDPRGRVPVSPLMASFAQAAIMAASASGGLVDATLVDQIEAAGYAHDLAQPMPLELTLKLAPPRAPAAGARSELWRQIAVDRAECVVERPPGVKLDSGGLAKGLFADVLAQRLAGHASFAINCAGDLAIGGSAGVRRPVKVESPFDGSTLHTFELRRGGVATSGIGRRSWLDRSGRPAHHLLDPASGRPAFTGIVQVTALAPSALSAEILAKAAILSGPRAAPAWLAHGGVIVLEDGSYQVVEPPPSVTLSQLSPMPKALVS
jgi:FAD:protein FMN transferase